MPPAIARDAGGDQQQVVDAVHLERCHEPDLGKPLIGVWPAGDPSAQTVPAGLPVRRADHLRSKYPRQGPGEDNSSCNGSTNVAGAARWPTAMTPRSRPAEVLRVKRMQRGARTLEASPAKPRCCHTSGRARSSMSSCSARAAIDRVSRCVRRHRGRSTASSSNRRWHRHHCGRSACRDPWRRPRRREIFVTSRSTYGSGSRGSPPDYQGTMRLLMSSISTGLFAAPVSLPRQLCCRSIKAATPTVSCHTLSCQSVAIRIPATVSTSSPIVKYGRDNRRVNSQERAASALDGCFTTSLQRVDPACVPKRTETVRKLGPSTGSRQLLRPYRGGQWSFLWLFARAGDEPHRSTMLS